MKIYKTANEVIAKKQSAIVIFTHGEHFSYDAAGNGSTGKWVVDPEIVEVLSETNAELPLEAASEPTQASDASSPETFV